MSPPTAVVSASSSSDFRESVGEVSGVHHLLLCDIPTRVCAALLSFPAVKRLLSLCAQRHLPGLRRLQPDNCLCSPILCHLPCNQFPILLSVPPLILALPSEKQKDNFLVKQTKKKVINFWGEISLIFLSPVLLSKINDFTFSAAFLPLLTFYSVLRIHRIRA